jgi:hypothetical protein
MTVKDKPDAKDFDGTPSHVQYKKGRKASTQYRFDRGIEIWANHHRKSCVPINVHPSFTVALPSIQGDHLIRMVLPKSPMEGSSNGKEKQINLQNTI